MIDVGDKGLEIDGGAKRNFLYVTDSVSAVITILKRGLAGEVYNIGGDIEESILGVVSTLIKMFDLEARKEELIIHVEDRAFNDVNYAIDCHKLSNLGWRPEVNWDEGLRRTIEWYSGRDVNKHWEAGVDHVLTPHPRHRIA